MIGRLLNPYRFGSKGGPNILSPVYPCPGAPNPGYSGNNSAAYGLSYTTAVTALAGDTYGLLMQDGMDVGFNGQVVDGAVLTHTDATQLLHGYRFCCSVNTAGGTTTIEVGLYDVTNGFTSNNPTLVANSKVVITVPQNDIGPKYYPLPSPIALTVGRKYAIARSSLTYATSRPITFMSYRQAANLPPNAGFAKQSTIPLPANWNIPTSQGAIEGPYYLRGCMGPDTGPLPVTMPFKTRYAINITSAVPSVITIPVTLNQAITGSRGVAICISVVGTGTDLKMFNSIKLGGVEGLLSRSGDAPLQSRCAGYVAFFPSASNLAAGTHNLTLTFAATGTSSITGDVEVFELDNVHQNSEYHYTGYTNSPNGTSETRNYPATSRPYDGAMIACVGGTSGGAIYRVSGTTNGATPNLIPSHLEFDANSAPAGVPLGDVGYVPTTHANPALYYGLGNVNGRHVMSIFMPARKN